MSTRGSWASYKLRGLLAIHSYRLHSSNITRGYRVEVAKLGHNYSMHQGSRLFSTNSGTWRKVDTNMLKNEKDKFRQLVPDPPKHNILLWTRWLLDSIITLLPFWSKKWQKLHKIKEEAEMVVVEVENVAKVVEKVATVVEEVSSEVADILPEQGKLKESALLVERVSKETVQEDAKITKDFIHKVDAVMQDLENLETLVEPIVNKIVEKESKGVK